MRLLASFYPQILVLTLFCCAACRNTPTDRETADSSAPPSDPLFELLPATNTGVAFRNEFSESEKINILTYGHLYNGGGVGVLDINNDGLQDLYFSSTMGSCKLYLNRGQFKFEDITQQAGVAANQGVKTGVSVADVNADGWQDFLVCRSGPEVGSIRRPLLFINNKDNTFIESGLQYGLNDTSAHSMATFLDYDRDGDLDLYLVNTQVDLVTANSMRVTDVGNGQYRRNGFPTQPLDAHRLYRNDGKRFTDVTQAAGVYFSAYGLSATVADFNEDAYADLYVGNDFIEPDFFYINQRNGKFNDQRETMLRHYANQTMGVDIGDINNDGLEDIFSVDMLSEDYTLQQRRVTTMKDERYNTLLGYGYGHQIMRNVLQLNNGIPQGRNLPSFSDVGCLAGIFQTDWSWATLIQDFDNDGWRDIYISNGYYRDVTNADFVEFGMDSIVKATNSFTQYNMEVLNPIFARIPQFKLPKYAYRNLGAAQNGIGFADVSKAWGLADKAFSNGAAYADLDNDGDLDLVVNNLFQEAFVYKNTAADRKQGHWLQLDLKGSAANPFALGAKVRAWVGDQIYAQEIYPARGFFSSVPTLAHIGLGQAATVDRLEVWFPEGRVVALEKVSADQRLTVKFQDAKPGNLSPLPTAQPLATETTGNNGLAFAHTENIFNDFERERLLPWKLSRSGPCLAVADVNGDGQADVFVGGASDQAGALLVQGQNGRFQPLSAATWAADKASEDTGAVFFDADGDGDQDLFVASGGYAQPAGHATYRPRLYLNDGKGNFAPAAADALPTISVCAAAVSAHDLDADGDQDLLLGGQSVPGFYPTTPRSFALLNEKGKFREATSGIAPEFANIGMVRALHWADLDGDKRDELIVSGEWMPICVFAKENGQYKNKTTQFGLDQYKGLWRSIASADFDGDGDQDLVCGNLGLNTRYRADKKSPLTLYARDFDQNGTIDPILCFTEKGKERPIAYRHLMIRQLPSLKKKFVRTDPYAQASLRDMFPAADVDAALRFEANELATLYLENKGGRFEPRSLPTMAQIAPTNAITCADLNKDGYLDILLAGNDYGQQVETGRIDAGNGCVLLGDGKGRFNALSPRQSGFWAAYDARALALLNIGGRPTALVANSGGPLQAFAWR